MNGWELDWPIPLWSVAALGGAAVGIAWVTYRFRTRLPWQRAWTLVGLRTASLLLVLVMASGLAVARYQLEKPELVILLDDSASMQAPPDTDASAGDAATAETRFQQAIQVLKNDGQRLSDLQKRFDLQIRSLSNSHEASSGIDSKLWTDSSVAATFPSSPIGASLVQTLAAQRGRRTAAIVVLSDGIVTEGISLAAAADRAASQGVPILAIGFGSGQPPIDVRVEDILSDRWALVGDQVELRTTVRIAGVPEGRRIEVQLVDSRTGEVLDVQTLRASGQDRVEPVTLSMIADSERTAELTVQTPRVPGEDNTDNNRQKITIEFRDQQLQVLLVQDQPSYEFRYLKHLLERVRSFDGSKPLIDLTVVLQSGDPRYAQQDESAVILPPVGRDALAAFDAVVLSDAAVPLLGQVFLDQLTEVVEQSGVGLVVIAGPRHLPAELAETPLASLMPVDVKAVLPPAGQAAPLPLRLTRLGQQTASMRLGESATPELPRLTAVWRAGALQPLARVLLETDESRSVPVVVTQLVGAGQVRLQLTDELFRMQSFDGTGKMYERYWLQCIRELARGKRRVENQVLELDVEGGSFAEGDAVPLRVAVPGKPQQVRVRVHADQLERTITLQQAGSGNYRATINGLPAGDYRAVLVQPIVETGQPPGDSFVVAAPPGELDDLQSRIAELQRLAQRSGGVYLNPDEARSDRLEASIPELEPLRVQPLPPKPLWNHPLMAAVLFGCLCGEWVLRRRWGML